MQDSSSQIKTLQDPGQFFRQELEDAFAQRQIKTYPTVKDYLARMLTFYVAADHLYSINEETGKRSQQTLAEMWLKAINSEGALRVELLKKLGDSSLYISGFFGPSLKRKIVDIDYYAHLGGSAYSTLAQASGEEQFVKMYSEMSTRFLDFVDVFTLISQKSLNQANQGTDLLRLFDRVATTGSGLAKDQLTQQGIFPPVGLKKTSQ